MIELYPAVLDSEMYFVDFHLTYIVDASCLKDARVM